MILSEKQLDLEDDPVREIRRLREENNQRFFSLAEFLDHLDDVPFAEEFLAQLRSASAKNDKSGK